MKLFKVSVVSILLSLVVSVTTTSCIPPTGGSTPTPVVSDSLAIGRYFQTNSLTTPLSTTIDGATVEINADQTVNIQFKQSIPSQFPFFYDFIGNYTKSGNSINFTVNYLGGITIPNPSRTISGTLTLITTVIPNKVRLTFNSTLPIFPATNGNFIFEK